MLLLIIIIALNILILYDLLFFNKLFLFKKTDKNFNKGVSVVICAKNEIVNLKNNLPLILEQEYAHFEVIVVNDQSIDTSQFFLEEISKKYKNLIIVNIDDFVNHKPGKKFALTLGIKTSKFDYLLLTDADCKPTSKTWIRNMISGFSNSDVILGYSPYKKEKGILNKLIRFDTFNVAKQYLSYALNNMTYMGVGRNLAYKKNLFFNNKGFASHINIPSGDDDLFIQEVAEKADVTIEISKETHMISKAPNNWKEWMHQKRRHLTTAYLYKNKFQIILIIHPCLVLLFWACIIVLLSINYQHYILLLIAIKLTFSYIINYNIMKKLDSIDLYWFYPIYEIFNLLIQGFFVLLNLFSKPKTWSR